MKRPPPSTSRGKASVAQSGTGEESSRAWAKEFLSVLERKPADVNLGFLVAISPAGPRVEIEVDGETLRALVPLPGYVGWGPPGSPEWALLLQAWREQQTKKEGSR